MWIRMTKLATLIGTTGILAAWSGLQPAPLGTGVDVMFNQVVSRAYTVTNLDDTSPGFRQAISRAVTVERSEPLEFRHAVSRAHTVVNRDLQPPAFQEAVSRAATVRNNLVVVESITPDHGGDTGQVTVTITGRNLDPDATGVLGYPQAGPLIDIAAIVGRTIAGSIDGTRLTVTFDLTGAERGVLNVAVANPDGRTGGLPLAFTIEEGRAPELSASILGRSVVRAGFPASYTLLYENRANVDVYGVHLFLSIPEGLEYDLGETGYYAIGESAVVAHLLLGKVAAQSGGTISFLARPGLTTAELSLGIAISAHDQGLRVESFAPLNPLGSPAADAMDSNSASGSCTSVTLAGEIDYSQPIIAPGSPVPPGYVDYYVIYEPGLKGCASPGCSFGQVGIHLDFDLVAWSFPGIGVSVTQFSGLQAGTFYDPVNNRSWGVKHAFSIRPDLSENMPNLVSQLPSRLQPLLGAPFADPGPDGPITPGTFSCVGLVLALLYQGESPVPEHPDHPGRTGTYQAIAFWLQLSGVDATVLLDIARASLSWPVWWGWWKIVHNGITSAVAIAWDPNEKHGLAGASARSFVRRDQRLPFTIAFENDAKHASAAARDVHVLDRLDGSTVDAGSAVFVAVKVGSTTREGQFVVDEFAPCWREFAADLPMQVDPGFGIGLVDVLVRVEARANTCTNEMHWHFATLDPSTHEPPEDPLIGFLPPNRNPPEGEGSVTFTVLPKADIKTGTKICNTAQIVFDANDPITACAPGQKKGPDCPGWCNTIDADPPASSVEAALVEGECPPDIELSWSAIDQDNGSGVRSHSVFVSRDGAPFVAFLSDTTDTSVVYPAEPAHAYGFYTRATDNVGNVESAPDEPDVVITTLIPADLNGDATVDAADWAVLLHGTGEPPVDNCLTGPAFAVSEACRSSDLDCDGFSDLRDVGLFQRAHSPD